jgi:bifunctional enzyme Fae/Hps
MLQLNEKTKYLQIAFNRTKEEVQRMIKLLPPSNKIIIEAGTPFIKQYGQEGIKLIKNWWSERLRKPGYIIADLKCMDRGFKEVEIAQKAGASAATCLGLAPIETINQFIENCESLGLDSMIDMLNVKFPFEILQKLKKLPKVIILHRGVDENKKNKEKQIPYDQIQKIKGTYNKVLISIAGGETTKEVIRAFFNNADIVVVWRYFYENPEKTAQLAKDFLKLIK